MNKSLDRAAHPSLRFIEAPEIVAATPWPKLIDAIQNAFASPHVAPDRHIHSIQVPDRAVATALLMPAWITGEVYGAKLANIFPSNNQIGQPAVNSIYALFSGETGAPLSLMDGTEITGRRTAATSALMSRFLSRPDSEELLIVGTGRLAPLLFEAHSAVRPIKRLRIWGHTPAKAEALAAKLANAHNIDAAPVTDLQSAVGSADIISTATISKKPLVLGKWLREGVHLDLVGAFRPEMCEVDPEAVHRSDVYIDTLGGAEAEAGDLIQAIAAGWFLWFDVKAELGPLSTGSHKVSRGAKDITMFKSVGAAIEDLAAARLVYDAIEQAK